MLNILAILLITNIYSYQINKLKIELDSIYKSFPYITKEIKQDQDEFIKTIDNCKDKVCIISFYKDKIKKLNVLLENSKTYPKELIKIIKIIQENSIECNKRDCNPLPTYYNKELLNCEELPKLYDFWQDFFRYKDIKIKPKIVDAKPYTSKEAKEALKYCWDLGLDRVVYKSIKKYNMDESNDNVNYRFIEVDKNGELYSISKIKGKKYIAKHKNITISDVVLDDKNYLALSGEFGDILFIEKDFCNHPMKNKNLLNVIKKSNKMKISTDYSERAKETFVMNYKGDDYILNYYINNSYYILHINSISDMVSNIYYYPYVRRYPYKNSLLKRLECKTNLNTDDNQY